MRYKLIPTIWPMKNGVIRMTPADTAQFSSGYMESMIPEDADNKDWQDYQAWLADGNTPEAAE